VQMTRTDVRDGKLWLAVQTRDYIILFDKVTQRTVTPQRFGAAAERRLHEIAPLLDLRKDPSSGRYPFRSMVPYFVHDPAVQSYGSVDFQGIDVPAGKEPGFYRHEESHAALAATVGGVPSLFNEGFACFAAAPKDRQDDRCCLAGLQEDVLPPLPAVCATADFWRLWPVYRPFLYRIGGSLVRWLYRRFSHEPFVRLARAEVAQADRRCVLRAFHAAYGISLHEAEAAWRQDLLAGARRLAMSPRRRMGKITESEWRRTRVEMVRTALGAARARQR
jgi:hypothetical protein